MIATTASGHRVLDPWLALLAGDRVWSDDEEPPDVRRRVAGGLELVALAFVVGLLWIVAIRPVGIATSRQPWSFWPPLAATGAAALLAARPIGHIVGHVARPAAFLPRLLWRGACFSTVVVALAVQLPGWPAVGAWALGIVVGADVMLSAWALGIAPDPVHWWRYAVLSPLHFGVIGALAAIAVVPSYLPEPSSLIGPYVALHVGLVVMVLTCLGLAAVSAQRDVELDAARRAGAAHERRQRAQWLHDDVLAEIRLTALRVQSGAQTAHHVCNDLEELDHRLRMRQVDELFGSGSARLADILQPHVRRAQTLGIRFTAMPSLDAAGRPVDEVTGRLFGRAVSVLISNAVNAGATTLAVGIEPHDAVVQLRVADDAGGFDFDGVPAGRGLERLAAELGGGNLRRIAIPRGSLMIADVPLAARDAPPANPVPAATPVDVPTPAPDRTSKDLIDGFHPAR